MPSALSIDFNGCTELAKPYLNLDPIKKVDIHGCSKIEQLIWLNSPASPYPEAIYLHLVVRQDTRVAVLVQEFGESVAASLMVDKRLELV